MSSTLQAPDSACVEYMGGVQRFVATCTEPLRCIAEFSGLLVSYPRGWAQSAPALQQRAMSKHATPLGAKI